jgi:hypothetical protein
MMDDKTPRQIRDEIVAAFASKGQNPIDELDRMARRLERGSKPDKKEIKNLLLLRDALAHASRARPVGKGRRGRGRSKASK